MGGLQGQSNPTFPPPSPSQQHIGVTLKGAHNGPACAGLGPSVMQSHHLAHSSQSLGLKLAGAALEARGSCSPEAWEEGGEMGSELYTASGSSVINPR